VVHHLHRLADLLEAAGPQVGRIASAVIYLALMIAGFVSIIVFLMRYYFFGSG
jgi:hypothetical protein